MHGNKMDDWITIKLWIIFIKIYFRVFIYKIIVLKYLELSKKEMKNRKRRMKMRLGTRTGQKTLEGESKRHPNMKVHSKQ